MRDYVIYEKANYKILMVRGKYIIHNTSKPFEIGHTHLKSYRMAKGMVDYCINKQIPNVTNNYLIISAIRLSDDEEYTERLYKVLELRRERAKNRYYNVNKGVKK